MDENKPVVNRENPLFGRKVYFVNPPLAVETVVFSALREEEYEVYIIRDYRYIKPVVAEDKDAMVLIYIDDALPFEHWYNFIKSFEIDEDINSTFIGVLSSKANFDIRQQFVMDLKLPGGFTMLNEPPEITAHKIKEILDINGAKGRRQYIRLDCKELKNVNGYFVDKDRLYTFSIDNISSVGFACTYEANMVNMMQKNTVHPGISLTVGKRTILCPSVIFDTRVVNNKGFSVLLFTKEVVKAARTIIKNFTFEVLDDQFNTRLHHTIQDLTDYSEKIKNPNDTNIPEYAEIKDSLIDMLDDFLPEI